MGERTGNTGWRWNGSWKDFTVSLPDSHSRPLTTKKIVRHQPTHFYFFFVCSYSYSFLEFIIPSMSNSSAAENYDKNLPVAILTPEDKISFLNRNGSSSDGTAMESTTTKKTRITYEEQRRKRRLGEDQCETTMTEQTINNGLKSLKENNKLNKNISTELEKKSSGIESNRGK
jgi:hypothetical protein